MIEKIEDKIFNITIPPDNAGEFYRLKKYDILKELPGGKQKVSLNTILKNINQSSIVYFFLCDNYIDKRIIDKIITLFYDVDIVIICNNRHIKKQYNSISDEIIVDSSLDFSMITIGNDDLLESYIIDKNDYYLLIDNGLFYMYSNPEEAIKVRTPKIDKRFCFYNNMEYMRNYITLMSDCKNYSIVINKKDFLLQMEFLERNNIDYFVKDENFIDNTEIVYSKGRWYSLRSIGRRRIYADTDFSFVKGFVGNMYYLANKAEKADYIYFNNKIAETTEKEYKTIIFSKTIDDFEKCVYDLNYHNTTNNTIKVNVTLKPPKLPEKAMIDDIHLQIIENIKKYTRYYRKYFGIIDETAKDEKSIFWSFADSLNILGNQFQNSSKPYLSDTDIRFLSTIKDKYMQFLSNAFDSIKHFETKLIIYENNDKIKNLEEEIKHKKTLITESRNESSIRSTQRIERLQEEIGDLEKILNGFLTKGQTPVKINQELIDFLRNDNVEDFEIINSNKEKSIVFEQRVKALKNLGIIAQDILKDYGKQVFPKSGLLYDYQGKKYLCIWTKKQLLLSKLENKLFNAEIVVGD